jgi:hypothetical protein
MMSALPPKADIASRQLDVFFVPKADSSTAAIVNIAVGVKLRNFRQQLALGYCQADLHLSLNEHRKRKSKCGALAGLRPEPSAKMGVGLETAVILRNSSDQDFGRKR